MEMARFSEIAESWPTATWCHNPRMETKESRVAANHHFFFARIMFLLLRFAVDVCTCIDLLPG
jgi:hypothetical protein